MYVSEEPCRVGAGRCGAGGLRSPHLQEGIGPEPWRDLCTLGRDGPCRKTTSAKARGPRGAAGMEGDGGGETGLFGWHGLRWGPQEGFIHLNLEKGSLWQLGGEQTEEGLQVGGCWPSPGGLGLPGLNEQRQGNVNSRFVVTETAGAGISLLSIGEGCVGQCSLVDVLTLGWLSDALGAVGGAAMGLGVLSDTEVVWLCWWGSGEAELAG